MQGCKLAILVFVLCVGVRSSEDDDFHLKRSSRQADDEKAMGIETKADDEAKADDEIRAEEEPTAAGIQATAGPEADDQTKTDAESKAEKKEEKPVVIEKKEEPGAIEAEAKSPITKDETTKDAEKKSMTNDDRGNQDEKGQEDQTKATNTSQPKGKRNNPPKIVIIKGPRKPQPESTLILGMEWWQLLCVVFGSLIVLLFLCVCCCAILDSSTQQQQRQEVRGPNGERLGFFQAPGRHIILVMDNNMSRIRGTSAARGAQQTTAAPGTGAPMANEAGITQANPPHAPQVQPIYPKV